MITYPKAKRGFRDNWSVFLILFCYYLRQEAYVIVVVCLSVCLSVCLLATLRKNFRTDLHEIFREGWQWASEQMNKFWWRPGSRIRIRFRIRIATLVRRALAEVCTVPVFRFFFYYGFVRQTTLTTRHLISAR